MIEPLEFVKKPVKIEAIQATNKHYELQDILMWIQQWGGVAVIVNDGVSSTLVIHTLEGPLNVSPGDWVIKGIKNEFYPCKPDIFDETYDRVRR